MCMKLTGSVLKENGYLHYEISNYAKPGRECRHNLGYWQRKDYLDSAGSLHSLKIRCVIRIRKISAIISTAIFPKRNFWCYQGQQIEETMFLGFGFYGVSRKKFKETFSRDLNVVYWRELEKLEEDGLIEEGGRFCPALTSRGIDLSNPVLAEFLLS